MEDVVSKKITGEKETLRETCNAMLDDFRDGISLILESTSKAEVMCGIDCLVHSLLDFLPERLTGIEFISRIEKAHVNFCDKWWSVYIKELREEESIEDTFKK